MDAIEYLKSLGPNPMSPIIIRYGYIMPGVGYEVSMDYHGLDDQPIWGLTVAREQDGEMKIDHDLSKALKSEAEADSYVTDLILYLDPPEGEPLDEDEPLNDSHVPDHM